LFGTSIKRVAVVLYVFECEDGHRFVSASPGERIPCAFCPKEARKVASVEDHELEV